MLKIERNKGITLIALVISIIVLLILAGVSISAITGNESAMEKAKQARTANEQGAEEDSIKLAVVSAMSKNTITYGMVELENLQNELENLEGVSAAEGTDENEGKFVVTGKNGRVYVVEKKGKVTATDPQPVTEITQKAEGNIEVQQGKSVKLRKLINTTPSTNIEALTYTKLTGDEKITVNSTTGEVSATVDATVESTATIKIAGSISTDVSITVTVEVIEPVKPHYDEPIILGEAIAGVNGDTNEDDWKILCYDEDKQKIYAILDSYLPVSELPTGINLDTDINTPYAIYKLRKSVNNDDGQTRDSFVNELTNPNKWRSLVSNSNSEIKVYGALQRWDSNNQETEGTMEYVKKKRGNSNFALLKVSEISSSMTGYWLASPKENNSSVIFAINNNGNNNNSSVYYNTTIGVCPVAILPSSIVEQNENGIWEAK